MIIGIDLGTTNSLTAIWRSGKTEVIPNALGRLLTPSVISIDNDAILIGEPALNRLSTYPELTIANFKRYMGTDKIFKLGDLSFRAEELSALVLKRLKEDAEHYLQMPITEAVISVPAYFSNAQRKATKIAGQLAGLKVERLINEPTAAGIAYGLLEEANDANYLIFDLGGGTFDVSILSYFSGVIEVRASSGDNFLGGIDFTSILEGMFIEHIKQQDYIDTDQMPIVLLKKIQEQAEIAKHLLSIHAHAIMKVSWNSKIIEYPVTDQDFEDRVQTLLQRLQDPVKKVLSDAKLSPSQIQQVILVGGASRMKIIKKIVSKMFGKLPLCHIDADTIIAQGVAIQSSLKMNDKTLEDIVVTDVCPYSLGVAVCSNPSSALHFDPIIERNVTIPISCSRNYYPMESNQSFVNIKIYQGESFFIEKNIFLSEFKVSLPKNLKDPKINIRFTYDINGILEVEAIIVETQARSAIIIEKNPGELTAEEINQQLEKLKSIKIHPRDKTENLLVISQAEKIYEELHGEHRAYFSQVINEFIHIIEGQNPLLISDYRAKLESLINKFQIELNVF
jgi:molecular chaperone HscC